jgi:hypothetical protein
MRLTEICEPVTDNMRYSLCARKRLTVFPALNDKVFAASFQFVFGVETMHCYSSSSVSARASTVASNSTITVYLIHAAWMDQ